MESDFSQFVPTSENSALTDVAIESDERCTGE